MESASFEKYQFLRLYAVDLDTALHTVKVLRRYKRHDVRVPLVRDVAVTYARPFSGNKGALLHDHQLSSKVHVPRPSLELHKELLRLRNEQFAHTDLRFYHPKVAKFKTSRGPWFPMSFQSYDYTSLLARLPEVEKLIVSVESSVRREIARYESAL